VPTEPPNKLDAASILTFEQIQSDTFHECFPPLELSERLALPVGNVQLDQFAREIHKSHCNHFWLMLEAQIGA